METAIWHKFAQHKDLREELLATGDAELIEVCGCRPLSHHFHLIYIEKSELRQGSVLGLWCRWEGEERVGQGAREAEGSTSWMKHIYHVPVSRVFVIVEQCVHVYSLFFVFVFVLDRILESVF